MQLSQLYQETNVAECCHWLTADNVPLRNWLLTHSLSQSTHCPVTPFHLPPHSRMDIAAVVSALLCHSASTKYMKSEWKTWFIWLFMYKIKKKKFIILIKLCRTIYCLKTMSSVKCFWKCVLSIMTLKVVKLHISLSLWLENAGVDSQFNSGLVSDQSR